MVRGYTALGVDGDILVSKRALKDIAALKAIVFDCDGVLIDVRGSYERTIRETIRILFHKLLHVEFLGQPVEARDVMSLRRLGCFNDDVDTTYILALWLFLNMPPDRIEVFRGAIGGLGPEQLPVDALLQETSRRVIALDVSTSKAVEPSGESIRELLSPYLAKRNKQPTVEEIESKIAEEAARRGLEEPFSVFRELLGYQAGYGKGLLRTVFEDLYYGPEYVRLVTGSGPYFTLGDGLFRNERLIISPETLARLSGLLGARRLGMATGRDSLTTKLVMGEAFEYFEPAACVFIIDELNSGAKRDISKPSPYSLIKSCLALGELSDVLYVGNSAEDIIMAQRAWSYGVKAMFMAVTGASETPEEDRELFASMGADIIANTPDELPMIMEEAIKRA